MPTPAELDEAPELAMLAALDHTLEIALRALVAAHPQLGDSECPAWVRQTSAARDAADRILEASRPLAHAIDAYRRAVTPHRDAETDLDPSF
jgi:hypothetical protein